MNHETTPLVLQSNEKDSIENNGHQKHCTTATTAIIKRAAYLIRDAVSGDVVEDVFYDIHDDDDDHDHHYDNNIWNRKISMYCLRICRHMVVLRILYGTIAILIALTFVEPPHWCRNYPVVVTQPAVGVVSDNHPDRFLPQQQSEPQQQNMFSMMDCSTIFRSIGIPASSFNDNSTNRVDEAQQQQFYPNTGTSNWLTVSQSHCIEFVCILIVSFIVLLRIGRDGMDLSLYLRQRKQRRLHSQQQQQQPGFSTTAATKTTIQYNRILQVICLIVLFISIVLEHLTSNKLYTQYNPYIRLILLYTFLTPSSQRDVQILMGVVPEVLNILFLLFVLMLFYAWFGVVMFVDTKEGMELFPTLIEGLWTLWICVTTANYPDVMMLGYNQNRFVALYFVSFMILSFFFLMNVILATVCNEYDTTMEQHQSDREKMSTNNLRQAYQLLLEQEQKMHQKSTDIDHESIIPTTADQQQQQERETIDRTTMMELFTILNTDFPEFRRQLTYDETQILFAILDRDGTSKITLDEFMNFGNVFLLELYKSSDYASSVEVYFPNFFHTPLWQQFRRMVLSPYFEYSIDTILILNAIVVGVQSYPLLSGEQIHLNSKLLDGSIDTIWEIMETCFTVIYSIEAVCKILVFGWKTYSEQMKNVFDFTITILAIISTGIVYYPNDYSDSSIVRMILSARVLRLIRLLTALQPFQQIGKITAVILPAAKNVILVLFLTMYLFAAIGMQLYGGMITRDPNNPLSYRLFNTDFADSEYWANNFNDMMGGMNVLFNLLVVNNWFVCEIGYEAVTQTKWVRLFFVAFHIMGVVLVNNLVIAFVINKFLQQMALVKDNKNNDRTSSSNNSEQIGSTSVRIEEDRAIFDASNVTGTTTNVQGNYIARFRYHSSRSQNSSSNTDDPMNDRDKFRTLFTQSSTSNSTE